MAPDSSILTINSGSSSIKFALYRMGRDEKVVFTGSVGGTRAGSGVFRVKDGAGKSVGDKSRNMPNHNEALREITEWLKSKTEADPFEAVGHRLVHGGSRFRGTHFIRPEMMETLEELVPYAADHLPHEIKAIRVFIATHPDAKEIACMEFLGILLDRSLNETNSPVISMHDSPVTVRVLKTIEELMIARHTRNILVEPQGVRKGAQVRRNKA